MLTKCWVYNQKVVSSGAPEGNDRAAADVNFALKMMHLVLKVMIACIQNDECVYFLK